MFKDRDLGYTRVCAPKGMHVISCPFAPVYTLLLNPSFCVECQTLTAFPQKNTVWSHAEMMLLARANALKHHRSCCIFLNLSNSKKHAKTTKDSKFAKTRDCSCFQTTILYRSPEDRALINAAAPTRTAVMIMNCLILEGKEKQKQNDNKGDDKTSASDKHHKTPKHHEMAWRISPLQSWIQRSTGRRLSWRRHGRTISFWPKVLAWHQHACHRLKQNSTK